MELLLDIGCSSTMDKGIIINRLIPMYETTAGQRNKFYHMQKLCCNLTAVAE